LARDDFNAAIFFDLFRTSTTYPAA
jgi:hypothetical protein